MRGQVSTPIAQIAAGQHGYVTRSQLLGAGLSAKAIDRRVSQGDLLPRYRGVYAVGHIPPSPHARAMAAVLACGPGAVLSHRSAAALWGLVRWPDTTDVTARYDHRLRGIRVHRSRTLTDYHVTTHYGVPTTTAARTLSDLVSILTPASLTRAVNDARLRHLLGSDDLGAQATDAPTRSVFEDRFLAFIDRHALPRPEVNQRIVGYEVDMLWRAHHLVAELDGRAYHDDFERDRERDADLLAAGLRVVRVTWRRLTRAEDREAARFDALLDKA